MSSSTSEKQIQVNVNFNGVPDPVRRTINHHFNEMGLLIGNSPDPLPYTTNKAMIKVNDEQTLACLETRLRPWKKHVTIILRK